MNFLSPTHAGSWRLTPRRFPSLLPILALAFLLLFAASAFAQEATIVGTVTDPTGAAVPNANISITNTDTGIVRTITTASDGQYAAPQLHIGHYVVKAEASGFKVGERKDISLQVGDRTRIDFALQVGNAQETITVEANPVAVQTESGEVSSVVTGTQITQLATNGRSVFSLEALTPGASSIQTDFMVPTSAGSDFNVSFNGQRVSHNLWLADGGEAADRGGGGGSDVLPSMDAIAEFRTMTSNYSAEYGLSSAGTISMVFRSGTKQLHADAWYFGRNDALDARNFFNPAPAKVAELRFHDFGFNVGGPVSFHPSKSTPKTFFFYNMEWRRFIQGGLFNVTTPLASMYPDASGNVVLPDTLNNGNPLNLVVPANITNNPGYANCDAATQALLTPGSPFPTNGAGATYIPSCVVDPNAAALLGAGVFPQPTSGWQFIGGNKQPTTGREELVRIDHQFTDKFSVFGHWVSDHALQTFGTTMWSGDNVPSVGNTFGNPSYHVVIHATYAIRPTLLNETSFNYNGNRIHILPQGVFSATNISGFTEGANRIFGGTNVSDRIPDLNLSGSTNTHYTVNWLPWNNTADDYQIRDDLSWTHGAHQFKFGGSWSIYKKVQDYFAETQGGFTFDGSATSPSGCVNSPTVTCGLDYADFVLGFAQHYNENAYKGTGHWNAISPAAYIQDNWRATSRLTVNLGLRWDGIPHTYEANQSQSNFYPGLYDSNALPAWVPGSNFGQICGGSPLPAGCTAASPGLGTSPISVLAPYPMYMNGIGIGGKNGIPKGLANNAWWNFGPRLGFAYDLTGNGKTVIRGGYGLMYERIQGNDMYNGATNPPFGYSLGTNNLLLSDPHFSWSGSQITVPIVPASVVGINQRYPAPRVSQYSLGVQQAIGRKAVLSASYVGSLDRHLSYWQELNLPPASLLPCLTDKTLCSGAQPAFNGLVPFQGYTSIKNAFNDENSHYNSLQVEVHGQATRDLYLQAAYTLSKAIDPGTGAGGNGWDLNYVTNPYQSWQYDIGPSVFDRRNIFFVNFVYEIPLLRNSSNRALKTLVGGWQLSGIVSAESGAPLNLALNGTNVASVFPGGDVANRPNLVGKISYPKTKVIDPNTGKVTGIQWADPSAFQFPDPGTWGNLGFNALRGPGRDNWNLSLFKQFILSESRGSRIEFRAESFNTWNHTQFGGSGQNGGFSNNFGAGNQLQITSAFDPRVFQLGLKVIY